MFRTMFRTMVRTMVRPRCLLDKPWQSFYGEESGRGTQVVRERSAKPLHAGSIPARASSVSCHWLAWVAVRLELSFRTGWAS